MAYHSTSGLGYPSWIDAQIEGIIREHQNFDVDIDSMAKNQIESNWPKIDQVIRANIAKASQAAGGAVSKAVDDTWPEMQKTVTDTAPKRVADKVTLVKKGLFVATSAVCLTIIGLAALSRKQ